MVAFTCHTASPERCVFSCTPTNGEKEKGGVGPNFHHELGHVIIWNGTLKLPNLPEPDFTTNYFLKQPANP